MSVRSSRAKVPPSPDKCILVRCSGPLKIGEDLFRKGWKIISRAAVFQSFALVFPSGLLVQWAPLGFVQ